MAVVAGVAARYVGRMFARGYDAIMAGVTGANDLQMVHGKDRCENIGVVAILANVAGLNVGQVLANGINVVMAVNTVARDIQVVEVRRQPAHR